MEHRTRVLIATVATTLGVVVLGAGGAFASIPDPGGVIHGCYDKAAICA